VSTVRSAAKSISLLFLPNLSAKNQSKTTTTPSLSALLNTKSARVTKVLRIRLSRSHCPAAHMIRKTSEIREVSFMEASLSRMILREIPMSKTFRTTMRFLRWSFSIRKKNSTMTVFRLQVRFRRSSNKNRLKSPS
jgi:hypothetical protein